MVITADDLQTCQRSWSRSMGAAARDAARTVLRADRGCWNRVGTYATWALDRMIRSYFDDPLLKGWLAALPTPAAQSAGRALLTRRFFRIAATEPGHHVIDYMVASFGRFNGAVAATLDVPAEHLDEVIWADLAGWVFQSLAKWRTAYIPAAPEEAENDTEDAAPSVHTLDERLRRLVKTVPDSSDPLLKRFHSTLEAVFTAAISRTEQVQNSPQSDTTLRGSIPAVVAKPCSNSAPLAASSGTVCRQPVKSRRRGRAPAAQDEVKRDFWWDAGRKSFKEFARSEVLRQVLGAKRFLAHGFMYSPAGRALRAFAGARIVNRIVYTVDCRPQSDPHGIASDTLDRAGMSRPENLCRHPRHLLRYPEQPIGCGCEECSRRRRVRRAVKWMVVTAPEYGHFSTASVCRDERCRRIAPETSTACRKLDCIDVWLPANPVALDELVNPHEGDSGRFVDRVAGSEPTVVDDLMASERLDRAAVARLDMEIRSKAMWVCSSVRRLLRRELADCETVSWKRSAVLAALFPDLGWPPPHAWEIRLLTNVLCEFRGRHAAIAELPVRLHKLHIDVSALWDTDPLTATNFGKLKSEIAKRWRRSEPLLRERLTELLAPSLTETLEHIDELLD